jgi:hypothetical protein
MMRSSFHWIGTKATVVAKQVTAWCFVNDHNATDQMRAVRGNLGGFIACHVPWRAAMRTGWPNLTLLRR